MPIIASWWSETYFGRCTHTPRFVIGRLFLPAARRIKAALLLCVMIWMPIFFLRDLVARFPAWPSRCSYITCPCLSCCGLFLSCPKLPIFSAAVCRRYPSLAYHISSLTRTDRHTHPHTLTTQSARANHRLHTPVIGPFVTVPRYTRQQHN